MKTTISVQRGFCPNRANTSKNVVKVKTLLCKQQQECKKVIFGKLTSQKVYKTSN
jgi:hypothetical protein